MPRGICLYFQLAQGFVTERSWRQPDHSFLLTLRHTFLGESLSVQASVMWETDQFRRM